MSALPLTFACVVSGVAYALISVHLGNQRDFAQIGLLFTFVTTFLMCEGGKIGIISFVPGAFMGSFSTFAAGGDFLIIACLAAGLMVGFAQIGLVFTFVTTFLMCAGGKIGIISFVPGAFMGSFSTFAAGGDFMIIPSIAAGIILGLCCDTLGKKLCSTFGSEE